MTFLTKPFNADELRARLRAGERIVGMQSGNWLQKNADDPVSTLDEIQNLYDSHRPRPASRRASCN